MKRLIVAAAAFVFVVSAPVVQATVTNTSPDAGATVPAGTPITLSWSTNNLNSPVFGGRVNIVVTRDGAPVLSRLVSCPSGGTSTCPTETSVGADDLPPGTYEWYVRWWIFVNGPPNEIWDASTPTGFSVDAVPAPPPAESARQIPPPAAPEPTAPGVKLDSGKSIRLRVVKGFAEASTAVTVDRAATLTLTVTHPRTGARLRLSAGSRIGSTISGRPHAVLVRSETGSARLAVRIRLPLAALRGSRTWVARISATNDVGTGEVSRTLRR